MKRYYFSYALLGLLVGFTPAAVIIFFVLGLPDETWGHSGGEVLHLLTLVGLGIPGGVIGCLVGARRQHGPSPLRIGIGLGGLVGTTAGFFAALILLGDLFSGVFGSFRGGTLAGLVGILLGGTGGILLGGRLAFLWHTQPQA